MLAGSLCGSNRSSVNWATGAAAFFTLDQAEVVLLLQHILAAGGVNQLRQADLWHGDVGQREALATSATTAGNRNNALGAGGGTLWAGNTAVGAAMISL